MPEPLRRVHAALLGCGHPHSSSHLGTLLSLGEVTGIHLWDPVPEACEELRDAAGDKLVAVHADLNSLLSDDRVEWAIAALRPDNGPDILKRCAAAGCSLMTEKPVGRDTAETLAVVQAFEQRGLALTLCYPNRHRPAARCLKEWLDEGLFGRLCSAETRLHTTSVRLRSPQHWLFDKSVAGGGILPWLGCHLLDLLRYLMGAEVVEVTCQCGTLSGEAIDVEDMAALTLRFDNEVLATATFGYLMPGLAPGNSFAGKDTYLGFKGTGGHVAWDPMSPDQWLEASCFDPRWVGAPRRRIAFQEEAAKAYSQRYGLEFARDCLRAAQEGTPGPATGRDMVEVWRIMEAAFESQATGRRVSLVPQGG